MALDTPRAIGDIAQRIAALLPQSAPLNTFATLLYAGADPEGIGPLAPELLASLASDAFAFIAERPRGRHKCRVRPVEHPAGSGPLSVLEVINDDMPFLVDSVMGEIQVQSLAARLVLHPIFKVRRSDKGMLESIPGAGDRNWADGTQESFISVHLDPLDAAAAEALADGISLALDDVRRAVADWHSMLARLDRAIEALERNPPQVAPGLLAETLDFCRWLRNGQFTFLGCREFRLKGDAEAGELVPVDGSGLGVLRDPTLHVLSRGGDALAMTPEIRRFVFSPQPLIITKSSIQSRIHRRVYMDYVGLKSYAEDGGLVGELRIVGLFTSQAYTQPPRHIPFLRHKVESVIALSGYAPGSHAAKALMNVLETFPRDELFRISDEKLAEWSRGVVELELRPRVRVFARPDRFDRFVSVLVYIQRDRFSTLVRERIGAALAEAYNGRVSSFTPFFPEGPLVRVHFIVGRNEGPRPDVDAPALERRITEITRTWEDQLASAIAAADPGISALGPKYAGAFSAGYAETFPVARALEDIARIERLGPERPVAIDFYREGGAAPTQVRAAIYRFDRPIPLSERVPILENLGFSVIDERSYRVAPRFGTSTREVALHDMVLETADGLPLDLKAHDARMEEAFLAVFRGEAENDAFNRLLVATGADWREVAVLRAYAAYLRQIRAPFGPRYIAETLNRHAGLAREIIEWFRLRFDPDRKLSSDERKAKEDAIRARLESAVANVPSIDEDRILRHYMSLLTASVRTNFFQRTSVGALPATLAFKLDSKAVDGLPEPKPFREIWVYSPRVEGIHMRFGAIARGGIRWSDRTQDFRTEVLDLAKAQQVKNTVIVPAGAKGGFVPKQMPRNASRDEIMREGIATYRIFISALLDLTDNIRNRELVPPTRVVRHDGDDPYLVVAADKGTATFSDFANEISGAHGFWLGDAFASGGSAGYDHKKMAITARGGWECVKRHFREMNIDIQRTPFRVTGVGDMSGDVFGNAMLLSPTIRLVAAFDHRDIFIDPDPDSAAGLAERRRLFELPRSSWQDYDKSKLSKGGGVFPRSSKSIALTPEIRALLGIAEATVAPAELMRAILRCETDLLWFGGIGTYVRASGETDEQVGDRANDAIRVAATELRAKVIGEGANLGLTQRGRIEFSQRGGRINTDFIDNSAGVNSSDQEVNIKIALGPAVASGRLADGDRRALLASMTDDVARACLDNNYQQSLALSLAERLSARDLGYLARLMRALEKRGLLDRRLDALPEQRELAQRQAAGSGMTRPELAVLLSLSKIAFDRDILASPVPEDPACEPLLVGYFPPALRESHLADLKAHRLAREIVATAITNAMINRGGPAFATRLADETGRSVADIAYAFLAVREVFDLPALWAAIDALDGRVAGADQLELYARVHDLVLGQTAAFLRQPGGERLAAVIASCRPGVEVLAGDLLASATAGQRSRHAELSKRFESAGVPGALAARVAGLDIIGAAPAIARLAREAGRAIDEAARVLLGAAEYFRLDELKARAGALEVADYYDRLAAGGALATLEGTCLALAREVLRSTSGRPADFAAWEKANGARLARAKAALDEIAGSGEVTVSRLTVAAAQVRDLAGA
jgi:glutamate dehydrogenase